MSPDVSDLDLKRLKEINDKTLADAAAGRWLGTWYRLTSAILDYRLGAYDAVFADINNATDWNNEPLSAKQQITALCFSAMAHHKLAHAAEGRADLDKATHLLKSEFTFDQPRDLLGWNEYITLQIHLREAIALIAPPAQASQTPRP